MARLKGSKNKITIIKEKMATKARNLLAKNIDKSFIKEVWKNDGTEKILCAKCGGVFSRGEMAKKIKGSFYHLKCVNKYKHFEILKEVN